MKNASVCQDCGGRVEHYDVVKRIVRTKRRESTWVKVERVKCLECGKIHRVLPEDILPYKQYEAEVIRGVVEGLITPEVLGFEDYPCEMTMKRWKSAKNTRALMKGGKDHDIYGEKS